MSDILKAYVAGLLDGEAYIGAVRRSPTPRNKSRSPIYSIRVSVAMADEEPIRIIARLAGAEKSVYRRDRKQREHHSAMWIIDLEADRANGLLLSVMPFLIGKRKQAGFACELFELKRSRPRTSKILPGDYLARCDILYLAMRRRETTNNGIGRRPWR